MSKQEVLSCERESLPVGLSVAQGQTKRYVTVPADLPVLIEADEAAALYGCTSKHIRDQCRKGSIRAVKLGRSWRIHRDSFLQQCGLK